MPNKNKDKRIKENIVAISINAGHLVSEGKFIPDDSATFYAEIIRLAEEFEEMYTEEQLEGDYLGKIDNFAEKKLLEFYGILDIEN